MIATEPLAERLFDRPHYARHGYDYWQQLADGQLVAGGFRDADLESEFTDEEATTPRIQAALERFLADLVGGSCGSRTAGRGSWASSRTCCRSWGESPDAIGVWVAGGYSGHGNVLGFACGALVARAILGSGRR